jgi:hypothetical protein
MNLDQFDERLKTVLENVEVPYDADTWQTLADRLDRLPADGSWMDAPLARRLGDMEAPWQPAHWDRMSARLDQEERRRRVVFFYKLAEAAIFLLLLGQVLLMQPGFDPEGGPVARQSVPESGTPARQRVPHGSKAPVLQGLTALPIENAGENTNAYSEETPDGFSEMPQMTIPMGNLVAPDLAGSADFTQISVENVLGSVSSQEAGSGNSDKVFLPPSVPMLSSGNWGLSAKNPALPATQPLHFQKPRRKADFYAGMSTGLQIDRIEPGKMMQRPISLDANVLWRKGKWGIETGARYARRRFEPQPQVTIYAGTPSKGQYGAYIREASAEVVSVPAHVTRRVARAGRVTAHAVAGFTANVAATKDFQPQTVYYAGSSPDPNGPASAPPYQYTANGLFEKGSFQDNHYLTADAGLRMEAPLGHRAVLFVESLWQQTVSGGVFVQPEARINGMGVYAGVLARL